MAACWGSTSEVKIQKPQTHGQVKITLVHTIHTYFPTIFYARLRRAAVASSAAPDHELFTTQPPTTNHSILFVLTKACHHPKYEQKPSKIHDKWRKNTKPLLQANDTITSAPCGSQPLLGHQAPPTTILLLLSNCHKAIEASRDTLQTVFSRPKPRQHHQPPPLSEFQAFLFRYSIPSPATLPMLHSTSRTALSCILPPGDQDRVQTVFSRPKYCGQQQPHPLAEFQTSLFGYYIPPAATSPAPCANQEATTPKTTPCDFGDTLQTVLSRPNCH